MPAMRLVSLTLMTDADPLMRVNYVKSDITGWFYSIW